MLVPSLPGHAIRRRLGRGGMGEVWLAERVAISGIRKLVAVKFVQLDDDGSAQFVNEARLSSMLSHSNVVQVFDVGVENDVGFLVMEYVAGADLATLARLHRFAPHVAAHVLLQIVRGLGHAHDLRVDGRNLRIVHRDMSPHNVLVSESGEVKIADFGIARSLLDPSTGSVKGKLRYMAPEQFASGKATPISDLFAAGVVFHELLAGAPMRRGDTPGALYDEIIRGVIPGVDPAIPRELEAIRLWLLASDVSARAPSADAVERALLGWSGLRDAAPELASMCRAITGAAPGSGTVSVVLGGDATIPADARGATATHTWSSGSIEAVPTPPRRSLSRLAVIAALILGPAGIIALFATILLLSRNDNIEERDSATIIHGPVRFEP